MVYKLVEMKFWKLFIVFLIMIGQGYWVSSLAENYRNQVFTPLINSAQVYLNSNQLDLPIMEINSSDVITVSFDWLSLEYAHLAYRIERPDFRKIRKGVLCHLQGEQTP